MDNGWILIVDDAPKNIQVLGTVLKEKGYQIKAATDGKQALAAVEKSLPDLILLDIMMPEMDGFATIKALKENPATRDIPVIFLTAKTETDDVVRGFELGAVDYVTKPFNSAELLARVKTHIDLKNANEQISNISRERKELVHVLCHDLANPIGFVSSVMDLNKEDSTMLEQMKEHIEKSMHNSLEIINLVRTMMALEDNKIDLTTSQFELESMIRESIAILDLKAKAKQITFDVSIPENQKVMVERVSFVNSVINNILTNAIKFSDTGGKIKISAREENDRVILVIKDNGIGMSEKLLQDLFDIRKKTSRKGTAGETGTGFGMPLIQKFVHAYGGEIRVSSREKSAGGEHGTEITFELKTK